MADVLSDVDIAVEQLKRAIQRSLPPPQITTFMGCTPAQIAYIKAYYLKATGTRPEEISEL